MNQPPGHYSEEQKERARNLARAIQEEREAGWRRLNDQFTAMSLGIVVYLVGILVTIALVVLAILLFQNVFAVFLLVVVIFSFCIFLKDQNLR